MISWGKIFKITNFMRRCKKKNSTWHSIWIFKVLRVSVTWSIWLLNENNLYLWVYKLKDKFRYLVKQDNEKKTILRELSACVVEMFNGLYVVGTKFDKKLRRPLRAVDIFYAPVKKPDQLVNCFLREKLNLVFRALCSDGPKSGMFKRSTMWQCYFCSNYYARKERYDRNIKILQKFCRNFKSDIPLFAYIDFETTAPTDTCLDVKNKNLYAFSYVIVFAFHPDLM